MVDGENPRQTEVMNELPVIGYPCLHSELWDRQGARRKCMAESCFDAQKHGSGERSTLLRRCFIANGFEQCRYMENVSFYLNNREICDKLPYLRRFIVNITLMRILKISVHA